MAHGHVSKAAAALSILMLAILSVFVVSCDIQFNGGTAIQEVFEEELVNDDVSLHPTEDTKVTISLVPDASVPETVLVYEVLLYRTNSKTLYRTIEVGSTYALELHDLPRASYRIVGRALTEGGVAVAVGEVSIKVSSNGADAVIELKDVGHIMERHDRVDATCTASGNIEHWHCTRCGLDFTDKEGLNYVSDTTIPAKGHSMVHVEDKAPTCTEEGTMDHWHCDRCLKDFADEEGSSELDDVIVPALGHKWSTEWSHDEAKHWHGCTRCSATSNVADHGMTVIDHKDATKDEAGWDLLKCRVCGFQRKDTIQPIRHDFVEVDRKEATCLEAGYVKYRCSDCGKEYTETIHKKPHATTAVAAVAATCTKDGNHAFWYCSTCGFYYKNEACSEKFEGLEYIDKASGHTWSTVWCNDGSNHWKVCTVCGTKDEKSEHVYDQRNESYTYLVSSATCDSPAIYYYSCVCGAKGTETFTVGEPLGHKLEDGHVAAKQSTCGEAGNSEYWRCTRTNCGKIFSDANGEKETSLEEVTIPATGKHVFTTSYHCDTEGDMHYPVCDVCGFVDKANGSKHEFVWDNDSNGHWYSCKVCHHKKTEKVPHDYKDGVCSVCGRYDENPASKPGFEVGEKSSEPKGEVTYTHDGNTWTFIFVDRTPDKENPVRTEELFWCLDGERQSKFNGKTEFILNAPRKQSYTVLCVYNNGKGYGSCEITVTGY